MATYYIPDTLIRIILKHTKEETKDFVHRAVLKAIEQKGWK
jgi:hypothetical protein